MGDLSAHFSTAEFICPCCGRAPMARSLIIGLEALRARLCKRFDCDVSIVVTIGGGYRCQAYNAGIRRCDACKRNYHLDAAPYACPKCQATTRQRSAKTSWHMYGGAADIRAVESESGRTISPEVVREEAEKVAQFATGGIGAYNTFSHVDIGPHRRWTG